MKWLSPLFLVLLISQSHAQENSNPFDVQVSVAQIEGRFHIQASYAIPMNICNAFAFITDYEGVKNVPGILKVKIISREGNKVRVYRVIEEQTLFFPIEMKSVMEFIETPYRGLTFEQISGDMKSYKGNWRLMSDKGKTSFKYDAWMEPDSFRPSAVIEYFMKNSIRGRFEVIAQKVAQSKSTESFACN
jgi:hypothetical protein